MITLTDEDGGITTITLLGIGSDLGDRRLHIHSLSQPSGQNKGSE